MRWVLAATAAAAVTWTLLTVAIVVGHGYLLWEGS
jgi:nitrate reductase NapE component